ncbi:MAG: hypothetical protein HYY16_13205 [Planctomycetes bacterium]|nr:hypothetical protein [Planctomycetota bacterium]
MQHGHSFLVPALFALAMCAPARAQEEREKTFREYLADEHYDYLQARGRVSDNVKLRGSMRTEAWLDDNILLSRTDVQSDLITVFTPNLAVLWDPEDVSAWIEYRGRHRIYADHSEFDGTEHFFAGDVSWRTEKTKVRVWDRYQILLDPHEVVLFSERVERHEHNAGADLGFTFNEFTLGLTASWRSFDVLDAGLDYYDYLRWEGSVNGLFAATDKTLLLFELGRSEDDFDRNDVLNDFDVVRALAGFRCRPTPSLRFDLKAGPFQVTPGDAPGVAPSERHSDIMVVAVVVWRSSQSSVLNAYFERLPLEQLSSGWTLITRQRLTYNLWLAERVTGSLMLYREAVDDPESSARGYSMGVVPSIRYEIGRNFVVEGSVEYRRLTNSFDERLDNVRGFLGFSITW